MIKHCYSNEDYDEFCISVTRLFSDSFSGRAWHLSVACILATLIGCVCIYVAFYSVWICVAVAAINLGSALFPLFQKRKQDRILSAMVAFMISLCTITLVLGTYSVISIGKPLLFIYWAVVFVTQLILGKWLIIKRISSGTQQKAVPVQSVLIYSVGAVSSVMLGRIVGASLSQQVLRLWMAILIIWPDSFFLLGVIMIVQIQIHVRKQKCKERMDSATKK